MSTSEQSIDALLRTCIRHEPFTLDDAAWRRAIDAAREAGYIGVQWKGQITVTELGYERFGERSA